MAFVAALLGDFDRYFARGDVDLSRDGVSYSLAGMWLDDAELSELRRELFRVFGPRLANPPKPGRLRRILGSVLLPGNEADRPPPTTLAESKPGPKKSENKDIRIP